MLLIEKYIIRPTDTKQNLKSKIYSNLKKYYLLIVFVFISSLTYSQAEIRKGQNVYSSVLYNWDGEYLREGSNTYSTPQY